MRRRPTTSGRWPELVAAPSPGDGLRLDLLSPTAADRDQQLGERLLGGRRRGRWLGRQDHLLDGRGVDGDGFERAVVGWPGAGRRGDGIDHVHPLHHPAEDGIGPGLVERPCASSSSTMKNWLPWEFGSWVRAMATMPRPYCPTTGSSTMLYPGPPEPGALGVATLDDEAGHDAVEHRAVVEAGARQVEEVLGRDRRRTP